jgi:hypothetical protein
MRRRELIGLLGGLTVTCPLRVLAQQGERIRHIAIMMGLAENDTETEARLVKFKNEMEKLGWSEDRFRLDNWLGDGVGNRRQLVSLR